LKKKCVCIPRSFLVINVCNQGKTLCSPCIILYAHPVEQVNLFNSLGNIISYEKEFHIDQKKMHNYLKITGILNNVFRPQKTLNKTRIKLYRVSIKSYPDYKHLLQKKTWKKIFFLPLLNPVNAELNPFCHLLVLLEAHHIFHVSGIRVKLVSKKTSSVELHFEKKIYLYST